MRDSELAALAAGIEQRTVRKAERGRTLSQIRKDERAEAIEQLRKWLQPGDTVYTVLRHVSRSGMQREISLYVIKDGEPQWLDGYASKALGERIGKREGLVVGGCGMDMGFHLVYNLSRTLFADGHGCVGERCPSNDHSNGDRDYTPHELSVEEMVYGRSHEHWHRDGGYALRHRWI